MPRKYHIKVDQAPPRFPPVPRYSFLETEGCLGCLHCVKRESCLYEGYQDRAFHLDEYVDSGETKCLNCLRCVQECKKNILGRALNPRYRRMGGDYWQPELIERIWRQAATGNVPVSGAGYRGPFCGPGFDQMWTDMSEIVRPTRDGIHGREYISTAIELGRRPDHLAFDPAGRMLGEPPRLIELPIPVILDAAPIAIRCGNVRPAIARAAGRLGTLAVATAEEARGALSDMLDRLIVKFDPRRDDIERLAGIRQVELNDAEGVMETVARIRQVNPEIFIFIRLRLDECAPARAAALAAQGAGILILQADHDGRGFGVNRDRFVTDLVREVHLRLVADCVRDQLSLLVAGGVAMAEHVAKIVICGADGALVDLALWVALECRLCADCLALPRCPARLEDAPIAWAAQRIVNLVGGWHAQLLEVLGAMGLREVRRLRGEVGRAMFFEDLERECFAPIFGERASATPDAGNGNDIVAPDKVLAIKNSPAIRVEDFENRSFRDLALTTPSRYRNQLSKYKVFRGTACIACGECARVCSFGVHVKAGSRLLAPRSHKCIGPEACRERGVCCVDVCPSGALRVGLDPLWEVFGDPRWTADLIVSSWLQAETGRPPRNGLEYQVGASGGGFDRMDFAFPARRENVGFRPADVDLSIPLNRRDDGRPQVAIDFPIYGGGMSFGSISLATMLSRARAYKALNSFFSTGEGGFPDELKPYDDHIITQVATGLFGVREETIQRVRIVEFKYAQGAKPGLGGHLLGDKVTPVVAKIREAVVGSALFSPFPFHSVYSVEDHKKHVDWIKMVNPRALVSVKVSTPTDVDMVAVGSYYAGAHIIHIDGSYGGTGAAPDIAKKNISMPIEYAIPKVHRFLVQEGIRDKITLIASGGLRTAWDIAKAIALGADGVVIGSAEVMALECIRCTNCESGRGCPRGIATTDPELSRAFEVAWGEQRLVNLFHSFAIQLQEILWRLGMRSVRELVGRGDLLTHADYRAIPPCPGFSRAAAR